MGLAGDALRGGAGDNQAAQQFMGSLYTAANELITAIPGMVSKFDNSPLGQGFNSLIAGHPVITGIMAFFAGKITGGTAKNSSKFESFAGVITILLFCGAFLSAFSVNSETMFTPFAFIAAPFDVFEKHQILSILAIFFTGRLWGLVKVDLLRNGRQQVYLRIIDARNSNAPIMDRVAGVVPDSVAPRGVFQRITDAIVWLNNKRLHRNLQAADIPKEPGK